MVEMTVQLDESLVRMFDKQTLERQIQEFIQKLVLKLAAQDILADLVGNDLQNDPKWQLARKMAWEEEQDKFKIYFQAAESRRNFNL